MVHIEDLMTATEVGQDSVLKTGSGFPIKPVLNCDQPAELDPYIYVVLTSL